MDWIQVTIYTTAAGIEPVSGRLYGLGITGIEIEDEADFRDFLENNKQYWDYVDDELLIEKAKETCVKVYVGDNPDGAEQLAAIKASMLELKEYDTSGEFGRLEISLGNLKEEDWANNWKQYYHKVSIGERLLVCPEWEDVPKDNERVVFKINPGMSFGTGTHHTTRMCLEELERFVKPGDTVLDLGCGSGILSIVSLLFGAKKAYAADIDPNARDIAYENAAMNGIGKDRYIVRAGNILTDEAIKKEFSERKYDIVAANIVADVIIALTPAAREYIKPDGIYITSGIIADRLDEVSSAICESGFEIKEVNRGGDWASIVAVPCGRK